MQVHEECKTAVFFIFYLTHVLFINNPNCVRNSLQEINVSINDMIIITIINVIIII